MMAILHHETKTRNVKKSFSEFLSTNFKYIMITSNTQWHERMMSDDGDL